MGTLFEYLKWRGDLTFRQAEINEVDSLIFSLLSYIDFRGIVSSSHDDIEALSLRTATNSFFAKNPNDKKIKLGLMVPKNIVTLLKIAKETRRFRNVGIKAHVNKIDLKRQMQFSATTFLIDDGSTLIAFRGTDDTIVGWKENFNMSFMSAIPSQKEAVAYLNTAAENTANHIYLTGHSKGGNLAVYASVFCKDEVRERLAQVWSNDGPGFSTSMLNNPTYLQIRPIVRTLIPDSTIVGILLEHEDAYTVVKSRRKSGVLQHDGLTWEVIGPSFVHLDTVSKGCKRFDNHLNTWIKQMSMEQREQLSDAIYQLLCVNNALTLTDLVSVNKLWKARGRELDPQVYRVLRYWLGSFLKQNFVGALQTKPPQKSK